MKLRNKATGAAESLNYGPAQAAVRAGTHEFIDPADASGTSDEAATAIQAEGGSVDLVDPDAHSKDELEALAEAEGVSTTGTKAEIADRINEKRTAPQE